MSAHELPADTPAPHPQNLNPNQSLVIAADPLLEQLTLTPEDLQKSAAQQATKIIQTILDSDPRSQIYDITGNPVTGGGITRTILFGSGKAKRGVDEVVDGGRTTYHFFSLAGPADGNFMLVDPARNQIRWGQDYEPTGFDPPTELATERSHNALLNALPTMFLDARSKGNVHFGPQHRISRFVRHLGTLITRRTVS